MRRRSSSKLGPLALQLVEPLGQLVEGAGDLAELVGALDPGAGVAVAGLEPPHRRLEPARRRARAAPEATSASTLANTAVDGEHADDVVRADRASRTISRARTNAATGADRERGERDRRAPAGAASASGG